MKTEKRRLLDRLTNAKESSGKKQPIIELEKPLVHWDYLIKEMVWMSKDFKNESKSKNSNSKKYCKLCSKQIASKYSEENKRTKQIIEDQKRSASQISKMVQMFWKNIDKIVKHNYGVNYSLNKKKEKEAKLHQFVNKQLKLSTKVAEQLVSKIDPVSNSKFIVLTVNDDSTYSVEGVYNTTQKTDAKAIALQTSEIAQSAQPTGNTLRTTKVSVKIPFLIKHTLREYQIIGLDWLRALHDKKINGILADEMGLGKTIQTIALLASLAVDKGIWGPHLIVVPTTIIINWEMEFKKWCPSFKILTYFGTQKERKAKRNGWSKNNSFHICITSYKLVIQDHFAFKRKHWYYMVLDEAQNIKNFKSQRWQMLLKFNTKRRILLTGTPLQNDVMELWSLMHFLMPQIFSSQQDFKDWFSNPFMQSMNSNMALDMSIVRNLHNILRPFLLRRLKCDVEKQLPSKIEHIVYCQLTQRQRILYDEYINSDKTQNVLQDTEFFSIMSVLMQLRKVCNHPDLFDPRHIESPFLCTHITYQVPYANN